MVNITRKNFTNGWLAMIRSLWKHGSLPRIIYYLGILARFVFEGRDFPTSYLQRKKPFEKYCVCLCVYIHMCMMQYVCCIYPLILSDSLSFKIPRIFPNHTQSLKDLQETFHALFQCTCLSLASEHVISCRCRWVLKGSVGSLKRI